MTRNNINAAWRFTKTDIAEPGNFPGDAETIDLPHTWNGLDGQDGGNDYYRGRCWYAKTVDLDIVEGQRAWIEFQGANSVAQVFAGGRSLGTHEGGYSTFRFDVTDAVDDGRVELLVSVDNSHREDIYPLMADFTFMGGLYRNVDLLITEAIHFNLDDDGSSGIYIHSDLKDDGSAEIELRALISTEIESAGNLTLEVSIQNADGSTVATRSEKVVLQDSGNGEVVMSMNLAEPVLWEGRDNPYLYDVEVRLTEDGITRDTRSIPFGIRSVAVDPEKGFLLNGKPLRLNGVSRHQDRRNIGWALRPEHHKEDLALIEEMGANSIRLAHYQHAPDFYDLCDRSGMVTWAEIPFISVHSSEDLSGANAKSQMIELVKQNYNHASIAFWGVQNEITIGGPDPEVEGIVSMLNDTVKEWDTRRLTAQAQVGHHPEDDGMNAVTDAVGYNKYFGWYYDSVEEMDRWLTQFAESQPNLALGITEYGAEGILTWHSDQPKVNDYSEEYHTLYHEKILTIFQQHPRLWGTYVWNMFDFASDLRDEGGVKGMNNKGLVTHDRKVRKDAFWWYKANWSEEPVLHLCGKRFVNRAADAVDIKVYANDGPVSLIINGQDGPRGENLYGPEAPVWVFRDVPLNDGENRVEVRCGDLRDSAVFMRVAQADPSYTCPDGGKNPMDAVANWFDDDSENDAPPLAFPQDRLSIKDKIKVILKTPGGEEVLRTYMAEMFDHPMFAMVKNFSIEKMAGMKADMFPEAFLRKLNAELNQIGKVQ